MTECIHGFEGTQCDVCFPTEKPAAPRPAPARRPAASTAPRSRAASKPPARPVALERVRVYRWVPIAALGDLVDGGLRNNSLDPLLSDLGRELRESAESVPGESVAARVPFWLDPDATAWRELKRGAAEPRWSAAARAMSPSDFAVLVTSLGRLDDVIVTDGDAAGTWTRFARGHDDVRRAIGRAQSDELRRAEVEVLAASPVDLEAIETIGVANEPAKDRARTALAGMPRPPRIAVYPPWFGDG